MNPFYLKLKMQDGDLFKAKSREKKVIIPIEVEMEKLVNDYVNALEMQKNLLLPVQEQRAKVKFEILEILKKLSAEAESAMHILKSEIDKDPSSEVNQLLLSELNNSATHIAEHKAETINTANLQSLAKISDTSMQTMANIATAMFNENRYEDSLSIFSFLSIFSPEYDEYWFRKGIAAQMCKKYDLALGAYAVVSQLDPNHIGSRLFSAECWLKSGQREKAIEEYTIAKGIIKNDQEHKEWLDLLNMIKTMIEAVEIKK